ncbi:MAG: hypothetical protein ACI906_002294 [Candidatus Latescibacterota bacterium]|jgi:hypothetical protein
MTEDKKEAINTSADKGLHSLQTLAVQFVSYLIEEGRKGKALGKIISTFTSHQTKLVSGLLGGAGVAGGAWAAVSLWTSSLGIWGSLGYAIGWVTLPAWIPIAGGAAGLTAAGGALYSVFNFAKGRKQTRQLRAIIGFSKMLAGRMEMDEEKLLRRFLAAQAVEEKDIDQLLSTTPDEAEQLARQHLDAKSRNEVARYIFPLVYQKEGVIGDGERRRFRRVCAGLDLHEEAAREISQNYRQRLDEQWAYMDQLIALLNDFASSLGFDGREMEIVHEELNQLMFFDPRRTAADKRERLLAQLGAPPQHLTLVGQSAEAALMGAYAMAHTAAPEQEDLSALIAAFDDLMTRANIGKKERKKLVQSRCEVDQLYLATREQINKMASEEHKAQKA